MYHLIIFNFSIEIHVSSYHIQLFHWKFMYHLIIFNFSNENPCIILSYSTFLLKIHVSSYHIQLFYWKSMYHLIIFNFSIENSCIILSYSTFLLKIHVSSFHILAVFTVEQTIVIQCEIISVDCQLLDVTPGARTCGPVATGDGSTLVLQIILTLLTLTFLLLLCTTRKWQMSSGPIFIKRLKLKKNT